MNREQQETDMRCQTSEESKQVYPHDKSYKNAAWAIIQDLFERAKTDPDCLAVAAEMGWGPEVFDEMKKRPLTLV